MVSPFIFTISLSIQMWLKRKVKSTKQRKARGSGGFFKKRLIGYDVKVSFSKLAD